MTQARIYNLTDPDLPSEFHHIRRIFMPPTFVTPPKLSGYQKARQTADDIKHKALAKRHAAEQVELELGAKRRKAYA